MKLNYRNFTSFLTLAGTIPFLFYLSLKLKLTDIMCVHCFKLEYLKVYSLMIISFISGYIWSYAYQKKSIKYASIAIIGSLLPWFNFMLNKSEHYFVLDCVYFILLLMFEGEKYDDHDSSKWYYKLRILTTSIVVISLLAITYL